jgi:hypothetical protein
MKLVEIGLRMGEGGSGRMMEGVNPTKINFKYICKYHKLSPCTTISC